MPKNEQKKIYYVNDNYPVSMGIYAVSLKQALKQLFPEWQFNSLSPIKKRLADRPNKYFKYIKDRFFYPLYLKTMVNQKKVNLFHIPDHSYAYLIENLPQEKTIITCHDLMIFKVATSKIELGLNDSSLSDSLIKRNMNRVMKIDRAAYIAADSQQTKQDLIDLLGINENRIKVVYLGLNYTFTPLSQVEKTKKKVTLDLQDKKLILSVGNSQHYKNLEGMIEASAINQDFYQRNNVVVVKVGSDFSDDQKKLIDKYGLNTYFKYLGYVESFKDLNDLYNIADLFLFPSYYEGFGWPPLEAMSCKTPVIASEAGSLKEVLNGAAFTIDPSNFEQIAQAIIKVLEDENLRDILIDKGITNAARFTWHKAAVEYAELYNRVFTESGT